MAIDINKPLRVKYEIKSVSSDLELYLAGPILLRIYNLACDIVNNGGIEQFNKEWDDTHPDDSDDEYDRAYERYFKGVADRISDMVRSESGFTCKLREHNPCLINFDEGYFTLYGYIERL